MEIALGTEVEDTLTGFKGIVTSRTQFLTGCARYGVQPRVDKDGKLPEVQTFDEITLKVLKTPQGKPTAGTGVG